MKDEPLVLPASSNVIDSKAEEPGPYFHPLLATLTTGAARLMLATAERLVSDHGLEWSFCDTDSIAIARPVEMDAAEFATDVAAIVAWFGALNPYAFGGSILNVEKVNFALDDGKRSEPLFCWAVSAKRYALFNVGDDGAPIMRKVSAHGSGKPFSAWMRMPSLITAWAKATVHGLSNRWRRSFPTLDWRRPRRRCKQTQHG